MSRPPLLDSRKLLAFVTLAHEGSFTRAAEELHLTQSAISHAIKSLEDELEVRLVERPGRKVQLTPPGEHFLEHAESILAAMSRAREELTAYRSCAAK